MFVSVICRGGYGAQMRDHRQGCPGRAQCQPFQHQDEAPVSAEPAADFRPFGYAGSIRLRITAAAIRTIEHKGGIDSFLRDTPDRKLSPEIRRLKRRVERAAERNSG